jgi:hypothetical protein
MKQCPTCGNTYTDASLTYCLSDGAALTDLSPAEEATVVRSGGDPMRVDIPHTQPIITPATIAPQPPSGSSAVLKVVIAVLILIILAIVGLGLAGVFYYTSGKNENLPVNNSNSNRAAAPGPTVDETEELRKRLADLEEKYKEQKDGNRTPALPPVNSGQSRPARVYSPRDGFLSIRSEPTLSSGARITTIAHGSTISVSDCRGETTADGRRGRWCRTSWNGYSGWVFDGFLVY